MSNQSLWSSSRWSLQALMWLLIPPKHTLSLNLRKLVLVGENRRKLIPFQKARNLFYKILWFNIGQLKKTSICSNVDNSVTCIHNSIPVIRWSSWSTPIKALSRKPEGGGRRWGSWRTRWGWWLTESSFNSSRETTRYNWLPEAHASLTHTNMLIQINWPCFGSLSTNSYTGRL